MKVLVTGKNGQLGHEVVQALSRRNIVVKGVDQGDFNLADRNQVYAAMKAEAPDAVIHCAAYTAVDRAEDEPEQCTLVNAGGTSAIAEMAADAGIRMLYVSTDYVFPGVGSAPYEVNDPTGPQSVYGRTKLQGEEAVRALVDRHFIVRVSWSFGSHGENFVRTMLRLAAQRDEVRVVSDQVGSPSYTPDLASLLCDMIHTDAYGTYHATNEGFCSWSEFAEAIFRQAGLTTRVIPITTAEYPVKAARPLNSRLSKKSLDDAGFARLPGWQDALERFL